VILPSEALSLEYLIKLCTIGQQINGAVTTDTIFIGIAKAFAIASG
jgi:hypothetical protein